MPIPPRPRGCLTARTIIPGRKQKVKHKSAAVTNFRRARGRSGAGFPGRAGRRPGRGRIAQNRGRGGHGEGGGGDLRRHARSRRARGRRAARIPGPSARRCAWRRLPTRRRAGAETRPYGAPFFFPRRYDFSGFVGALFHARPANPTLGTGLALSAPRRPQCATRPRQAVALQSQSDACQKERGRARFVLYPMADRSPAPVVRTGKV